MQARVDEIAQRGERCAVRERVDDPDLARVPGDRRRLESQDPRVLGVESFRPAHGLTLDGKSPSSKGAIIGAGLAYRWKPSIDIAAGYDLTYMSASFGDKAMNSILLDRFAGSFRCSTSAMWSARARSTGCSVSK